MTDVAIYKAFPSEARAHCHMKTRCYNKKCPAYFNQIPIKARRKR